MIGDVDLYAFCDFLAHVQQVLIGIDRDGTLLKDTGRYPGSEGPSEVFELCEGAIDCVKLLNQIPNSAVAIISNQSGLAQGRLGIKDVERVNNTVKKLLELGRASIQGIYFCEHVSLDYARTKGISLSNSFVKECSDMKPNPGMLFRACKELLRTPPEKCNIYMIGDRSDDVLSGLSAGGKSVFVKSSVHQSDTLEIKKKMQIHYDKIHNAKDLIGAAEWIIMDVARSCAKEISAKDL